MSEITAVDDLPVRTVESFRIRAAFRGVMDTNSHSAGLTRLLVRLDLG